MNYYFIFNHIVIVLCSINILFDYEGQSTWFVEVLDIVDMAFYAIYLIEITLRIYLYKKYLPLESFDRALKL
jgi:hypothetical protein